MKIMNFTVLVHDVDDKVDGDDMADQMHIIEVKPDYFYNSKDWKMTYHDMETMIESIDPDKHQIIEVGRLVDIKPVFFVRVTDPEDVDCYIDKEFSTREEAEAAIEEDKAIKESA